MAAGPILFFFIGLGAILTMYALLDFWFPLVIFFTVILVIVEAIFYLGPYIAWCRRTDYYQPTTMVGRWPPLSPSSVSQPTPRQRVEDKSERVLRKRVQKEWDDQSKVDGV